MSSAGADSTHRVRRLALQVRGAPSASQALQWRSGLRAAADEDLAQALQQALDAVAAAHGLGPQTVHLPKLALHLSLRSPDDLLPRLREGLIQALGQALTAAADAPPPRSAPPERARALWMHYLAHGRVPWFDDTADAAQLLQALREGAAAWLGDVERRADRAPWAPGDALAGWAGWPATAQAAAITRLLRVLDAPAQVRLRELALRALRAQPRGPGSAQDQPAVPAAGTDQSAIGEGAAGPAPRSPTARTTPDVADLATLVQAWWQAAADGATAQSRTAAGTPASVAVGPTEPAAAGRGAATTHMLEPPAVPASATTAAGSRTNTAALPTTSWLAHDAGLVLLHPFLPTLFQAIGVLAPGGRQLDTAALPRAAAMLGWLLHGRDAVHEFELTLGRLLLGLGPDDPLPLPLPQAAVDATLRHEGEALLAAVVAHWSALGQTAPASLRTAFLARDGRLWRPEQPNGRQPWQLRVADEAYDLLLGRLPWALGTVRLPWMPVPLQVQWGTWGSA